MKKTNKEKCIIFVISIVLVIASTILPYFIFKTVMRTGQHTLYEQISLGAVLVSMASAIIAIAASHMDQQYDRVMLDVDILFKDLTGPGKWQRWPFVPRSKTRKLYSGGIHQFTLKNPEVEFDLGTHGVKANIPTCALDFFDLPAFSTFLRMLFDDKKFYSYVQRKGVSGLKDPCILREGIEGWMLWDCMYDIWKSIVVYRIEKLMIRFLAIFIGSSVLLSFLFSQIIAVIK